MRVKLTVALSDENSGIGSEPPTEFRIFRAGANESSKGTYVFDDGSAANTIAAYETHGADIMIDYEHASLDSLWAMDPAMAGKAAGWCKLEVRNGELWAVGVTWTPPAQDAIRNKEWRYISPAFDARDGRIVSLINIALTNLPATRNLEPLVAASRRARRPGVRLASGDAMQIDDPKIIADALDALIAGDNEKCAEILKGMIAGAAGGESDGGNEDAGEPDAGSTEEPALAEDPPAAEDKEDEEDGATAVAAASRLIRLTGKTTIGAALDEVTEWHKSHVQLASERKKLAAEREVLEADERQRLCAQLVVECKQAPATVWQDPAAEQRHPRAYLQKMSIAELREHVSLSKGSAPSAAPVPPRCSHGATGAAGSEALGQVFQTTSGNVTLSKRELAMCAEKKLDPKQYAELKASNQKAG